MEKPKIRMPAAENLIIVVDGAPVGVDTYRLDERQYRLALQYGVAQLVKAGEVKIEDIAPGWPKG